MARTAVVTGGASGLGKALALELARRGWDVVLADLNAMRLAATRGEVEALGRRAWAEIIDVRDPAQVQTLLDRAVELAGGVELWVNNAGVAAQGRVGECPLDDWRWLMDVNLWGVVHGCHVAVPHMKARGSGHVLNIASAAGLISTGGMAAYNASKAAVVSITRTLAVELAGTGVGATVACPTFFETNLLESARWQEDAQIRLAGRAMRTSPLTADDVARAVLDDVEAGRLHAVPMADGRWLWRVSRVAPDWFYRNFPAIVSWWTRKQRS